MAIDSVHAARTPAPPPDAAQHRGFRADIEGIRALAVVIVALNHADIPGFGGGYVGVDVFFVISGFLITGLLLKDLDTHHRVSIADFYARRVRRILPLSALVAITTVAYAFPIYGASRAGEIADDGLWAGLFAANWRFSATGVDYFNRGASASPLEHYWSLGVEEQFYVVWPILLLVLGLLRLRRLQRSNAIIAMLAVICVVALAWSIYQTAHAPTAAYFSPFTRAWELGLGALLATALAARPGLARRIPRDLAGAGLVLVVAAVVLFDSATPFPGIAAMAPVLGTLLLIAGGTTPGGAVGSVLGSRPLRFVGERSYGFYLWHLPFLIMPAALAGGELTRLSNLGLLVAAFAVSCLTYAFVEQPFRHSTWLKERAASVTLAVGLVLVLLVLSASLLLKAIDDTDYRSSPPLGVGDSGLPGESQVASDVVAGAELTAAPKQLDPPVDAVGEHGTLSNQEIACDVGYEATTARTDCVLGDPNGEETTVLFGDSHAMMWMPAMSLVAEHLGQRLVVITKPACAPLANVTPWHPQEDRPYDECRDFVASAVAAIQDLAPTTIVMSGAFRGWAYEEDGSRVAGGEFASDNTWTVDPAADERWNEGVAATLEQFADVGARLVMIGDIAYPREDAAACIWTHRSDLRRCTWDPEVDVFAEHNQGEQDVVEEHGGTYVSVVDWLCTSGACPPVIADRAVYLDQYHLTRQYSLYLANALAERMGVRQ